METKPNLNKNRSTIGKENSDYMILEIQNLKKYYKTVKAVDDISFSVNEGEIFGFVGQNGAGKSTAIRAILGLIRYQSGEIKLFGKTLADQSDALKNVGFVPSEIEFAASCTAKNIFDYTLELNGIKDHKEVDRLCNYFEVNQSVAVNKMSFGNKKKIALIQALIKNPKLLILDEPTNGLDPLMQERLFVELLARQKFEGLTVFLSSHNLGEVERYCSRVAVIKQGKLLTVDTVNNIIDKTIKKVSYKLADGTQTDEEWKGSIEALLIKLSDKHPIDLTISNCSIQEEFMKYYEK